MRDYLYLWHQRESRCLFASGIQFSDIAPQLTWAGGIVLLRHAYGEARIDWPSGFAYVPVAGLVDLVADDIGQYGDFCWADYQRGVSLSSMPDASIAALTFFAHTSRPLKEEVEVPGLQNRLLYWGHDDGWISRIYYTDWNAISPLLKRILHAQLVPKQADLVASALREARAAYWCHDGKAIECEQTEDVDGLQAKYLP